MNNRRVLQVLAATLLGITALAQESDVVQIGSPDVLRVAAHIACNCGCKETAACPMALTGCGFCNPARVKIAKMQLAGMKDKPIIDSFIKDYGAGVYRGDPNNFFWMIPYGALALGLLAIYFFLRHALHPKTAGAGPTPAPNAAENNIDARYMEAAEKETSRLEQ